MHIQIVCDLLWYIMSLLEFGRSELTSINTPKRYFNKRKGRKMLLFILILKRMHSIEKGKEPLSILSVKICMKQLWLCDSVVAAELGDLKRCDKVPVN